MEEIKRVAQLMLPHQEHLDHLAVGVVDFARGDFEAWESRPATWFDLASVSKVLVNAAVFHLHGSDFTPEMRLLLEHRAGLYAWGLLPRQGWREQLLAYEVKESPTFYSDFSALRVMLEYEKRTGRKMKADASAIWDEQVRFWRDLPGDAHCPKTGEREGRDIIGEVHDPNAWNLKTFCSHAGLFGTVHGVCRTLLNLEKKTGFIAQVSGEIARTPHRFVFGWDRVENPEQTLAGKGCSAKTIGHLGFTGTSVWIDAEKRRGHVILSNATRDGWYLKEGLNEIRRAVGEIVWR